MDAMPPHSTGYRREVLAEIQFAEKQLMALAAAVPAEDYTWSPAENARSFAAVLVHIAAANLFLLARAGAKSPDVADLCSGIEGDSLARLRGMAHKGIELERTITAKAAVIDLLARSFAAVRQCWMAASEEELWVTENFLGELETVRRIYLRILAHAHEHMGQAIAYVRTMGYHVPWPDPLKTLEEKEAAPVH